MPVARYQGRGIRKGGADIVGPEGGGHDESETVAAQQLGEWRGSRGQAEVKSELCG